MKYHKPEDLIPRWEGDILPGLIEAEENRAANRADLHPRNYGPTRHNWGNRDVWRFVDPTDPWSELVNREGFTPAGVQLFKKGEAA